MRTEYDAYLQFPSVSTSISNFFFFISLNEGAFIESCLKLQSFSIINYIFSKHQCTTPSQFQTWLEVEVSQHKSATPVVW